MAKYDDNYYLTRAPLNRALIHLAVPMMAASCADVIYNIINAGIIGQLHSTVLFAAITFGLPLTAVVMAIGGMFGTGGSSILGRLLGEYDVAPADQKEAISRNIKDYSAFTIWGSFLLGLIVGILGIIFINPITTLLGASGDAFEPTKLFALVLFAGTPILVSTFALQQLVRVEGAAKISMIALISSTIVNLVFDLVLIIGLGLNVFGAALAVVLSNLVSTGILIYYLGSSHSMLTANPKFFKVRLSMVTDVLSIGVSELFMSIFILVSSLLFNHIAVRYGDAAIAGFGISQRIVQFPEMLAMGVGMGIMPIIANATGRKDHHRIVESLKYASLWVAVIVAIFVVPVFIGGKNILYPFSNDPAVLRIGFLALTAQLVAALFNGFTGLIVTYCQASGKSLAASILSAASGILFIPFVIFGSILFGLYGVVWSMTIAEIICFIVAVIIIAPVF